MVRRWIGTVAGPVDSQGFAEVTPLWILLKAREIWSVDSQENH